MSENPAIGSPTEASGDASLENHEERRPLTGGAVMAGLSRGAVAVTGAATTIIVARLLGPAGSGSYAVAQTVIILLTVATTFGAEHGIAYYVSSGRWDPNRAFRSTQWLAVVSGLGGVSVALLARVLVPHAFRGLSLLLTLVAAAALPFALSWLYASYVAVATERYESYVLPPALQSGVAMGLVAALGALDGVPGAVVAFTVAHGVTALALFAIMRRGLTHASSPAVVAAGHANLRRAVTFGIKGYAANALQIVNYRLDLFILNATAASAAVGRYSVAVAVTSVLWLLPSALSDVVFPRVAALSARSGREDRQVLDHVEAKTLRHSVLATIVVVCAIVFALLVLVVPVYGPAFRQATVLGLILLPGVALLGFCGPLSATIVGRGRPDLTLAGTLVVTPLTVLLYALLIPLMHATGAALGSSLSYAGMSVLTAVFYRRVTGTNPLSLMVPTRSEVDDYRNLAQAVRRAVGSMLARLAGRRSGSGL